MPIHIYIKNSSIKYVHGDLCKHLGIVSSTDPEGWSFFVIFDFYVIEFYSGAHFFHFIHARVILWSHSI